MRVNKLATVVTATWLCSGVALASPQAQSPKTTTPPTTSAREPVSVARKDSVIGELLKKARSAGGADATANPKAPTVDESVTQVALGGQCGFAGCSSSTLVAFTYRTRGANTMTQSVLALVSCSSVPTKPCTAVPAEVRAAAGPNSQTQ